MSELDKDIVMECYNKLHRVVSNFMNKDYPDEAFEAIVLLMSTAVQTRCIIFKSNVEQTMEDSFDSIADYVYGLTEDEIEEE